MSHLAVASHESDDLASRAKRLRSATREQHDTLDERIMGADPFGNRSRYATFLNIQHEFHLEIDPLYGHPDIVRWIPDIESRRRLDLIRQDILDVGATPPAMTRADYPIDLPDAVGWLYVAEGSNLGAAFLLKEAGTLGLTESFGARHLAGHIDGRAAHWRRFTSALDTMSFSPAEEARAIEGAKQAFVRVRALVDKYYGPAADNGRVVNIAPSTTTT
jgi:heme oxygenase